MADECGPAAAALGLDGPRSGRAAPAGSRGRAPARAAGRGPAPRRSAAPGAARLASPRRDSAASAAAVLCARPRRRRAPPPAQRAGNVSLSQTSAPGPRAPHCRPWSLRSPAPTFPSPPPAWSWLPKPLGRSLAAVHLQQSSCFHVPFCLQAAFAVFLRGLSAEQFRDPLREARLGAALAATFPGAGVAVQARC